MLHMLPFIHRNIIWFLGILLAFGAGMFFSGQWQQFKQDETSSQAKEYRESGYAFINPLLECEYIDNQGNSKLTTLKDTVEKLIAKKNNQHVSLYYRDLLNGPWYGYKEDESFSPQSLLKLPIIFAYLKIADENPGVLGQEILYEGDYNSNLDETENLKKGESYPVEMLISRTIQESDNVAFGLLVNHLPLKFVEKVHQDLNIPYPDKSTPEDFVSVKSYSSIFRVLYNASYLSRSNSEFLLQLLSSSDFKQGLVAGVPDSVIVAHKFGIKNPSDEDPTSQLHDCGIVYHPKHPYLLCIMTKGTDQKEQTATIKELSEAVYNVIDSEK